MDIEKLFEEAVEEDNHEKLEEFIWHLMDHWVYFFMIESEGNEYPVSSGNIVRTISVSKKNLARVPTIKTEDGIHGVLYTNRDLAINSAEFRCKVGKMKGVKAFQMFYGMPGIDAIYVQCNTCNVRLPREKINYFIEIA